MVATWSELCADKQLRDLPYRIETNRQGQIIMTPHKPIHSHYQSLINHLLDERMSGGVTLVECAIKTKDGTKVADVAWCSRARWLRIKTEAEASIAPEICVEVMSGVNTEVEMAYKRTLYIEAGAQEVWLVDSQGAVRFFDRTGELPASRLVEFPRRIDEGDRPHSAD